MSAKADPVNVQHEHDEVPDSDSSDTDSADKSIKDYKTDSVVKDSKKPVGVSEAAWQKFQQLKEKRISLQKRTPHNDRREKKSNETRTSSAEEAKDSETEAKKWKEVKNYLGTFDHLEAACSEQHYEKSGLEKKLDKAIAEGNVDEAEELSDQMANRQFGSKIATAFDAQRFAKRRKEKDEELKEKKKRKLNWQFEHKEKWEMKANM